MKPSLEGVTAKIDRAEGHLNDLKRILDQGSKADVFQAMREDPQAQKRFFEVFIQNPPDVSMPARILIGDIVHCLATALDHLIYQLSLSHQLSIGNPNAVMDCAKHKTHFPIFADTKDDALKRIDKRLELMAQAPADIIRDMQPYKGRAGNTPIAPERHPLWILFKLDVIDKHRLVLAANQLVRLDSLTISRGEHPPNVIQVTDGIWQPFKDGTKLFEIVFGMDSTLHPDANLNPKCALSVRLTETGLGCEDIAVVDLLTVLIYHVESVVVNRLARFVG